MVPLVNWEKLDLTRALSLVRLGWKHGVRSGEVKGQLGSILKEGREDIIIDISYLCE